MTFDEINALEQARERSHPVENAAFCLLVIAATFAFTWLAYKVADWWESRRGN